MPAQENTSDTAGPVPFIDLVAQYQTIRGDVREAVDQVFECQSFVLGDEVSALESQIADYCDARYAVGCASGTDALILSLLAVGVSPGDEVITSTFTFFATASAIHRLGARPVFVDIEPNSFNLCPEQVEQALTRKTRAILPVHLFGQCAEMEPLWRLSARHKIPVVEDACQAIGAQYRGRSAGVLGTVGCFSFFPTKNLGGAGDGGMIVTDDAEIASRLRRLRVHGDVGGYNHVEVGFNSRLDALQAAVLKVKLGSLDQWSDARRNNAKLYHELFRELNLRCAVEAPPTLPDRRHVYNQFTIRVRGGRRDEVMTSLRNANIGCAVYYPIPLHMQTCFEYLGYGEGDFPEAERACQEVLSLPIYAEVPDEHQRRVVAGLTDAVRSGSTITFPDSSDTDRRAA
ncbi:MAG: DegT/DnrJ/EryC1/StrS family aminotransferase [Fuerstiella sp.]|nr:DegT/DnrJ/EryC1/StrS family aminotransferase [Fuerstiella sp.]